MTSKGELSIKKCLTENNLSSLEIEDETERFILNEDSITINDMYNELPDISLTNIGEAEQLTSWLNKNVKPKSILQKLFFKKLDTETKCKKLEKQLRTNHAYCSVRLDTLFLILEYETDDRESLTKALDLLELTTEDIEFEGEFITENYNVSLTNAYIKISQIKKGWLIPCQ